MRTMWIGLLAACNLGGSAYEFDDWDADKNGEVSYLEFADSFQETWDRWDDDGDSVVTTDELAAGLFADWDRDNSKTLSEDEFGDRFFSGTLEQFQDFSLWDADQDDAISEEEFLSGWRFNGAVDDWNVDGEEGLTIDELTAGLFDAWDTDDSEALTDDEWGFGFL